MVTKYQNDPSVMKLMSKHFYLEKIFDDSSNNPKLRWRHRNLFNDKEVHLHRIHDHDSYDKSQDQSRTDSNDTSQGRSDNVTNSKKTNIETKHTFVSILGLPFSCSLVNEIGAFSVIKYANF